MASENNSTIVNDRSEVEELDQLLEELSVEDSDVWSSLLLPQYESIYDEEPEHEPETISDFKFDLLLERVMRSDPQDELDRWIETPDPDVPHVDFDELLDVILSGSEEQVERCIQAVDRSRDWIRRKNNARHH